jgi:subtilisin family serine protease
MLTLVAAFGLLAQGAPASAQVATDEFAAETAVNNLFGVSETGLYVVQLTDPSLASYTGGIAGLAATSPEATGARKLDADSPASRAYLQHLTDKQTQFTAELSQKLDRSVEVAFNYTGVLNAIAIAVSHEEAAQIAAMPGVAAVYGDTYREIATDVGPALIGAPAIWNGDTGYGVATRGEGIIIGVIDSGINSQHPSFAATDGDGYSHTNPYGAGVYNGWCAANPGFCNEKLIGAYNFHPNGGSPEDTDGHGSHTASTAGGNAHIATFDVGNETYNIPVQGVAPRANIVAYKVCDPTCPGTSSIAAVNSAILNDEADVLNYSISGVDSPWTDAVDLAFLDASNAGIFVSASAGNAGPGPSTVAKTGPWNASVAASTHNRAIGQTLDVTSQGEPAALQGLFVVPGEGTSIVTDINSGILYDSTNNLGCDPFAPGTFTGNLALIQRGGCTFAVKATNAQNAGATGVVLFQSVGGPPITAGGNPAPPLVMMDLASGIALRDHILANPTTTTVRINATTSLVYVDEWEDIVAGFSSRGPSQFELLKPDYIAPGVNILAAVSQEPGDPVQYGFLQGTSMSSPHGAGAGALMMALHPTWSPAEIRSAMATTAVTDLFKEDGLTPADPFDIGSGRLDLSLASNVGLVFDETGANYAAANPAIGGDPKTLNQPSVVNYNCVGDCTWTREVKSTLPISATYTASFSGPAGMTATVTPSTFTIEPGATQVIEITADVSALTPGGFAFGTVTLSTTADWPAGSFAPQGTATYNGDTTSGPTWNRPSSLGTGASGSCTLSGLGTATPYSVQGFTVDTTGAYTLSSLQTGFDGYIHLYQNAFDPLDPCLNQIALDDDGPGGVGTSEILDAALLSATTYYLVTTGFDNTDFGPFTNTINGPGEITLIGMETGTVASTNIPVVVVPVAPAAIFTLDPESLAAEQLPDQVTAQTLTIGNDGGVDLEWEVVEDPPLTASSTVLGSSTPILTSGRASVMLGDGLARSGLAGEMSSAFALPFAPNATTITHSTSQTIMGGNAVACSPDGGVTTSSNQYLRAFTLADFGIFGDFDVTSVDFGIENLTGSVNRDITVNLYTLDGVFTYANLTLIGTATASVAPQALTVVNVPVTGTAPAGSTLVVEIDPGDLSGQAGFFIGSNNMGQTAPSYIRSTSCSIPEPTPFGNIGFPGVHIVMNVIGETDLPACDAPTGTGWVDVNPLSGTVAGSATQDVTVTFDSTGLMPGEYNANLCLESNDPERPLAIVPLSLEVLALPSASINVDEINGLQAPDTQTTHMMEISNLGQADLNWYFEEAEGIMAAGSCPGCGTQPAFGQRPGQSSLRNDGCRSGQHPADERQSDLLSLVRGLR